MGLRTSEKLPGICNGAYTPEIGPKGAFFMRRIFLTGLSGAGKSTVGRRVASLLNWDFIDTDDLLSERAGMPVGQALVEYGEERFRRLESEALRDAASRARVVVATGGGSVIS